MESPRPLLETFEQLLEKGWRPVFAQGRTFERARRLLFGLLVSLRLHLTSQAICATGRQFRDWSADYRVCARSPWQPPGLFDPIFDHLAGLLPHPEAAVLLALDDTQLQKTGRHIPGVSIGRDPLSPPFHVNLRYGLRFVQASVLVAPPGGDGAARALPVRFEFAPPAPKPKKPKPANKKSAPPTSAEAPGNGASAAQPAPDPLPAGAAEAALPAQPPKKPKTPETPEQAAYKEEKKRRCLPQVGVNVLHSVRASMDQRPALRSRRLIVTGDGSYTTRLVLRGLPERTVYIGRIRKDAKLHAPLEASAGKTNGRPRQYGRQTPTPEQILRDDQIPWTTVRCFAAGQFREIRVKVWGPVYWRNGGVDLPVQVVVVAPLGYRRRKGSKLLYRRPAFLICTDPSLDLLTLVQAYIYRWEIECNHRDEKSLLGVGQGQVWNPDAVRRLPQLQVAGYSLLLLASLLSSGFRRSGAEHLPLPKWRRVSESARPSLLDMLNLIRNQIFARGADAPVVSFEDFLNTAPAVVKASKLPLAAETLGTVAA